MRYIFSLLLCLLTFTAGAQNKPTFKAFASFGYIFGKASDNGKWVTQYQEVEPTGSAQLINLDTYEIIDLQTTADIAQHGYAVPVDVTDDGNILVGSYEGCPAYYNRSTKTWTKLSTQAGHVAAVTPDGHYAVGSTNNSGANADGYEVGWYTESYGKMWDLTTNEEVFISDMAKPYVDPHGNTGGMMRFADITPDGRYILGGLMVDYPDYAFIIDRQAGNGSGAFNFIGYKAVGNDGLKYECTVPNMFFNEGRSFSPNGKWAVCNAYFVTNAGEFHAPIRYNVETGEITAYSTNSDDQEMYGNVVDNDGNVYAATPSGSPIREFYIRSGKYWYGLRSVLMQKYGIDFERESGLDNTGTPYSISNDGRVFTAMVDPQYGQNMVMKMNENLVELCNGLNLLGVYTIEPGAGSQFSTLNRIKITFDRDIEVVGEQSAATFGSWSSLADNGIYVDNLDSKAINVVFRTRSLENGKEYEFCLPAGTVCVKGDKERTNDDITARFKGRTNQPVGIVSSYPSAGSSVVKIDNTSSPILLTTDCDVVVTDAAEAWIETVPEGKRICNLTVAYKGNSIALYPATTQYLYNDVQYRVVLAAGSVTDVTGGGANAQYTLMLYGSYEREASHTNGVLFADDFNNMSASLAQWILFDGDGQTPTEEMKSFEFDNDNTPWNFSLHEIEGSTDYCAGSHSCYTPAAQSHDWMVSPQIYIPDNLARLSFLAQSYRKDKKDVLQVYVWQCDDVITEIGEDEYFAIVEGGDKVVEATLTPGNSEDGLDGDWQEFSVDLSRYSGKNIYIAFGNENNNQSMIFVDNVTVYRDMPFTMAVTTPDAVENQNSVPVAGKLTVANTDKAYSSIKLELKDVQGNLIDVVEQGGLNLKPSDSYSFTFAKELPLVIGELNRYSIDVYLDGALTTLGYTIKNLVFTPRKHVVLEEKTGVTCGNCPQGILSIEHMQKIYGSQFIPISIHTYDGDQWGSGLSGYTSFLNLAAAPTAIIQRNKEIVLPMTVDDDFNYTFSYNGTLWMDKVAEEMDRAAEIEVKANIVYDQTTGIFEVPMTLRSAINLKNQNLNVFLVLMEDGLLGYQDNYFAGSKDPLLGDWGQGGKHGQAVATGIIHNDVARYCYGSTYAGTSGLLPQDMEAGKEYVPAEALGGELPGTIENVMNAKVAVIIIDANTDRIVNAYVAHFDPARDEDGITPVFGTSAGKTYNMQGIQVGSHYRGIVIRGGKKYIQ